MPENVAPKSPKGDLALLIQDCGGAKSPSGDLGANFSLRNHLGFQRDAQTGIKPFDGVLDPLPASFRL